MAGKLGADVELRDANGHDVCTISVATDDFRGKGEDREKVTDWHRVVWWGQDARFAAEYVHKGDTVYIEGKNKTRKWADKDGIEQYTTEVVAHEFQKVYGKRQDEGDGAAEDDTPAAGSKARRK
ncbi:MAG: single-stranded DNA-binding protein [Burkholderia gladioli]